jgi:hypothetical protein
MLHPSTFRPDGVGSLNLEGVAAILGLDSEWTDFTSFIDDAFAFHDGSLSIDDENRREDYSRIMRALLRFLRSNAERSVETQFWGLLAENGAFPSIGVTVDSSDQRKFDVGGMLAFPNYAVRGITDATYVLENRSSTDPASNSFENYMLLRTECKTNKTFPKENLWYRGTRAGQVLGALWSGYGANKRAPTHSAEPEKIQNVHFFGKHSEIGTASASFSGWVYVWKHGRDRVFKIAGVDPAGCKAVLRTAGNGCRIKISAAFGIEIKAVTG